MRKTFLVLFCIAVFSTCKGELPDTVAQRFSASASLSFNSNGVNPIPSFSLGKPAVQANISLSKGRFSYDPGLAYGVDAKPWYIDNWFHFIIINKPVFKLRTGINFSMFFSDKTVTGEKFLQGQRYWTGELAGIFSLPSGYTLTMMYWSDNGQEHGTLTGHFISFSAEKNDLALSNSLRLSAYIQLFTIQYDQDNKGFFITPRIALSEKHLPLSLFFQATQPLVTRIKPNPGFQWDIGVSYSF